jgi:hypothetical protein
MRAALLLAIGGAAAGMPGAAAASPGWPMLEPLPAALASGRVAMDDLRGREVYAFDETRIGTLVAASGAAVVALDPRLNLIRRCISMPLWRLRLDAERRLLLDMTPQEFQAALAAQVTCTA